jgi:nucleotide-binding universal stress UspA family protein
MKNILLLVHDDGGQSARLHTALDLTRALGGHLTCIDVTPTLVYGGNSYAGFGDAILLNDERDTEAKNKARLTKRLDQEGVDWSWKDATGNMADCVLDVAMLADLIVLNCALEDYSVPNMRSIATRVLMRGRKPIVAVPENASGFKATGRVLIAWDGQDSVAATMRASIPLLQLASDVCIFMARDGAEKTEPAEAAVYLSRHGIHATVKIIDDGRTAADHLIAKAARDFHADYVLMGAYSHGTLMESFGGVTKRMLTNSKLPLVVGH